MTIAGALLVGAVLPIAHRIEAELLRVKGVAHVAVAGSLRRHCETVGDLDMLVAAIDGEPATRTFASSPEVQSVLARGPTKTLVRLSNGIDADLRVVEPECFGAALLYFTGSKAHNVALRTIALHKDLKLNEYGLFRGKRRIAARTEEEIYEALGLDWIPPEMREDRGEVELAAKHHLPRLVEAGDIRGDLHTHTSWTDGSASIEEMARAARGLGREYIVISDHTRDLAMTGGLTEAKLRAQVKKIRRVDRELDGIRVLAGAEVNIRPDGSLDVADSMLAELDIVTAGIHSHFDQPRAEMTRRVLRAVENRHVDILGHPLGRALGRRHAVDLDFEAVLRACVGTGTILEIDAQPERLDLPDTLVREAIAAGALIAIDSDAHTMDELRFIETFGLGVARRAWAEKKHVVNTRSADAVLDLVRGKGRPRPATRRAASRKRSAA